MSVPGRLVTAVRRYPVPALAVAGLVSGLVALRSVLPMSDA